MAVNAIDKTAVFIIYIAYIGLGLGLQHSHRQTDTTLCQDLAFRHFCNADCKYKYNKK